MNVQSFPLDRTEARSLLFSEQEAFWTIPLHETGVIMDVAVSRGKLSVIDTFLYEKPK